MSTKKLVLTRKAKLRLAATTLPLMSKAASKFYGQMVKRDQTTGRFIVAGTPQAKLVSKEGTSRLSVLSIEPSLLTREQVDEMLSVMKVDA